jgi:hypothetical protein
LWWHALHGCREQCPVDVERHRKMRAAVRREEDPGRDGQVDRDEKERGGISEKRCLAGRHTLAAAQYYDHSTFPPWRTWAREGFPCAEYGGARRGKETGDA